MLHQANIVTNVLSVKVSQSGLCTLLLSDWSKTAMNTIFHPISMLLMGKLLTYLHMIAEKLGSIFHY